MHLDLLHLGLRAGPGSKQENQTKHCDESTAENIASHFFSLRSKSSDETSGCGSRATKTHTTTKVYLQLDTLRLSGH
jgi:hypothetical protein